MTQLILIRHSISQQDSSIPANQWRLSQAGREACQPLAEAVSRFELTRLISSMEPKAIETARLTADHLKIPTEIAAGLHEHDRSNIGYLGSQEQFDASVKKMFDQPGECVFGLESADQAHARFATSVESLIAQSEGESFGIVSHGTVIALFTARANEIDPHQYWQGLEMPAIIALTIPRFEIIETISQVIV